MKKVLLFCLFTTALLFAQSPDFDHLLSSIEQSNFTSIMGLNLKEYRFNKEKITTVLNAPQFYCRLMSKHGMVIFKNIEISDSLLLNRSNCRMQKLIFFNCLFNKNVTLENTDISTHIAFIGSRFKDDIHLKRISCENLTFLTNTFDMAFHFTEAFGEDQIAQMLIILNSIKTLSLESFNTHGNTILTGRLIFNNISLFSNRIDNVRFSGISCKKLMLFSGNILHRVEFNDIKLDYLLALKLNVIDSCQIINCLDKEKGLITVGNNSIKHISIRNNTLRYTSITKNLLHNADFKNLKIFLSFQFMNNLFRNDGEINFNNSDFASFSFSTDNDSILIAVADTLPEKKNNAKLKLFGTIPEFPIKDATGKLRYVSLNQKWVSPAQGENRFAFNLKNMIIDEKNWHIHFDHIRKTGNYYRINPRDSVLSSRHEVYTAIYNAYRRQGKWKQADDCYYEWKQFERKNYWALSDESFLYKLPKVLFHYLNWISCGYGIKPLRVFPFAVLVVFVFALFYFVTPEPISNLEHHLISTDQIKKALNKLTGEELKNRFTDYDFNFEKHKQDLIDEIVSSMDREELSKRLSIEASSRFNLNYLWNCFYFSFSTFTTVGLGDWYPSGNLNRAIVMLEGALGWLSLGLFITTYANVLLR